MPVGVWSYRCAQVLWEVTASSSCLRWPVASPVFILQVAPLPSRARLPCSYVSSSGKVDGGRLCANTRRDLTCEGMPVIASVVFWLLGRQTRCLGLSGHLGTTG